jgi:hypothetical protein
MTVAKEGLTATLLALINDRIIFMQSDKYSFVDYLCIIIFKKDLL